MFMLQMDP